MTELAVEENNESYVRRVLYAPPKFTKKGIFITFSVIICLFAGLYIGAKKYKGNANRSACIINQSAISNAIASTFGVSSYANDRPVHWDDLEGPTKVFTLKPVCPSDGIYTLPATYGDYEKGRYEVACSCKNHQLFAEETKNR